MRNKVAKKNGSFQTLITELEQRDNLLIKYVTNMSEPRAGGPAALLDADGQASPEKWPKNKLTDLITIKTKLSDFVFLQWAADYWVKYNCDWFLDYEPASRDLRWVCVHVWTETFSYIRLTFLTVPVHRWMPVAPFGNT